MSNKYGVNTPLESLNIYEKNFIIEMYANGFQRRQLYEVIPFTFCYAADWTGLTAQQLTSFYGWFNIYVPIGLTLTVGNYDAAGVLKNTAFVSGAVAVNYSWFGSADVLTIPAGGVVEFIGWKMDAALNP